MYVCMYVCIYVCMNVCMCVCIIYLSIYLSIDKYFSKKYLYLEIIKKKLIMINLYTHRNIYKESYKTKTNKNNNYAND